MRDKRVVDEKSCILFTCKIESQQKTTASAVCVVNVQVNVWKGEGVANNVLAGTQALCSKLGDPIHVASNKRGGGGKAGDIGNVDVHVEAGLII